MIKRRTLLALPGAVAVAGGLAACGGGKSTDSGNVRVLNATSHDSIDLRISNANLIAGVAKGTVSAYVEQDEGTTAFQFGKTSETTTLLTQSATVAKDVSYTFVAYTTSNTVNAAYFADTEAAPSSGTAKIRLFNGAAEAGSLDLYVITPTTSASGATATNATVNGQRVGTYTQVSAGTWDIVITGAGDAEDERLTISSVTLGDQDIVTVVATATAGGVLVNGILLKQASTATSKANDGVRLRVVADLSASGVVQVTGASSAFNLTSPSIGNYRSAPVDLTNLVITAGGRTLDASVLVNAVDSGGTTSPVTAGSDLTLLVHGESSSPELVLLRDVNTLPTGSTKSKIRLVHGVNNLPSAGLTLSVDFDQLVDSVDYAESSAALAFTVGSDTRIQVFNGSTAVYDNVDSLAKLAAQSVYTLFLLGDSNSANESKATIGRIVKDR